MKNDKNFSIFKNDEYMTISSNRFNEYLSINLNTLKLRHSTEIGQFGPKLMDCFGIIGIISLINTTYLIVITEARCIALFCKREIYKVTNTAFIPFYHDKNSLELLSELLSTPIGNSPENIQEEKEIIANLKIIFKTGFYFSNKLDLANSLSSQNQIIIEKKSNQSGTDYDYIVDGNHSFLANYKLAKKLIINTQKNSTRVFISNCIYGNVEQFKFDNNNESIQIILISRRNIINYGISYYKKGLTKEGYNSNLIETELILVQNNEEIYSTVYLSSYLPLFYKKEKEGEMNELFDKHFKNLIIEYNLLIMFLLKEGNNEIYIKKFIELIHNNKQSYEKMWKFFSVDKENNINNILNYSAIKGSNLVEILGCSHFDSHLKFIRDNIQIGVFSFFGIKDSISIKNEISLAAKLIYGMYKNIAKKDVNFLDYLNSDIDLDNNFKYNYNQLLRENTITMQHHQFYDNLKIIFQRRFFEMSPQYYFNNKNIEKIEERQRLFDLLFSKEKRSISQKEEIKSLREEFSTFSNITIFVGSWNTGSTNINKYSDLSLDSWLKPKNDKIIPNIYLIGLQEVVELSTVNIVSNSEDKQKLLKDWALRIEKTLSKIGKYKKMVEMNLVGINFYFYALDSDADYISNITNKYVKTGLGGAAGNKGSCCINFNYFTTSISVACAHLAAGKQHNKQRLKELTHILNLKINEFQSPNDNNISVEINPDDSFDSCNGLEEYTNTLSSDISKSSPVTKKSKQIKASNTFSETDIWIILGDLNFRIDMEYEEFSEFIKTSENWNKLLQYDQFNKNKTASLKLMEMVEEDPILHPPTYKYIVGSDSYDYTPKIKTKERNDSKNDENLNKSGKKRNPSWCDRIFYKKNCYERKHFGKIIRGIEYNNVMDSNFQTSDHRPIYNIFDVIVFEEDKNKRNTIEKQVESNEKLGINSKYFKTPKYNL